MSAASKLSMRWPAVSVALLAALASACGGDDESSGKGSGGTGGSGGSAGGAGTGGVGGAAGAPVMIPDHTINEQLDHTHATADSSFDAEKVTLFRTTDALPQLDVTAIEVAGTAVYAGTPMGLFRLDAAGAKFEEVTLGAGWAPVVDLSATSGGGLLVARSADVYRLDAAGVGTEIPTFIGVPIAIAAHGSDALLLNDGGLFRLASGTATQIVGAGSAVARDLVVAGDEAWIATDAGIRIVTLGATASESTLTAPTHLLDDDVHALAVSGTDVLAASATGLARIPVGGSAATFTRAEPGKLPTDALRAVTEGASGVLVGHAVGASFLGASAVDHYVTERWLPANDVRDVALAPDGTRWFATSAGVARIELEPMTLAQKAAANEALLPKHWRMDGFVDDTVRLSDPWDPMATIGHWDNDNDGLWSHMQLAAWCFAYAETGDEQYYDRARKVMDVIQLQFDVPWLTFEAQGKSKGFITRSLVRDDEGPIFEDKKTQPNWHLQEHDGRTYYWKDDTSSDEYAGHYFGIPVFHDLCAKTDAERAAISERVDRATRYIIENDYLLIDLDGEPTAHGDWQGLANAVDGIGECIAQRLDECAESFGGGGWLNSIEILGLLLSTWHITGDDYFYEEYERLHTVERYGDMVPLLDTTVTVTTRGIGNHSDHELASLAYYTLLRYEPNADRRARWQKSIADFFEWEKPERNILEIAVLASATPDAPMSDAVRTLREMPLDWREWRYDNSHRKDYAIDKVQDRFDQLQFTAVPPYDEIRTMKWNGNPYVVVGGSSGSAAQAPWPWLLPYWMLRYYGALTD